MKINFGAGSAPRIKPHFARGGGLYEAGELTNRREILLEDGKLKAKDKFTHLDCLKMMNILSKTLNPTKDASTGKYLASRLIEDANSLPDEVSFAVGEGDNSTTVTVTGEDVRSIIVMFAKATRSTLLAGTQIDPDFRRFGALTPFVLYAFKDARGIQYEDWSLEDEKLGVLLGKALVDLPEFRRQDLSYYEFYDSPYELREWRMAAFSRKVPKKDVYNYNINGYPVVLQEFKDYPKPIICMMLQGWLAHLYNREIDVMILDPENWDAIPKAYDEIKDGLEKYENRL
jgi:hypothetical protein